MMEDLQQRFGGKISAHLTRTEALKSAAMVHRLLAEWNPVGSTADEVKSLMGLPTAESEEMLEYRFDSGLNADVWRFFLDRGRVSSVEHNYT